ncbi:methyltransferase domain-containing protein [Saccharothrix longispora]|uniref:SAM-dependent methyltransferase n=1 Tax=Saccharothrix longispora TaxID=33920 RepID=A0ABU1Q3I3_9PSEU|nr:methyltransferase domain-containing protein [Saccharothrix longispora]MDR6597457.1 SAM-dependent methyltransferase [Saccharothrix longispora]
MNNTELEGVRDVWEHLGATDPYWAVLTEDEFHGGEARARFFDSGRAEVAGLLKVLDRDDWPEDTVAVDFGCGVGRISFALAEHFGTVVGVDVAASMLAEARANNPFPERVRFVHNDASTLPFEDDSVDLVVTVITLQHIPPSLTLRYLLEMIRVVKPGGRLLFQLPSHMPKPQPLPVTACRANLTPVNAPRVLAPGESAYVEVDVRNDGDRAWPTGQLLNLGNHWFSGGEPRQWDDGRMAVPGPLAPGRTARVGLRVNAPTEPGEHELVLDLVQESVAWWAELGNPVVRLPVSVIATSGAAPAPVADAAPEVEVEVEVEVVEEPPAGGKSMQMHGIHKDLVVGLFEQLGCRVLAAVPDDRAGSDWVSYLYAVEIGEYELRLR